MIGPETADSNPRADSVRPIDQRPPHFAQNIFPVHNGIAPLLLCRCLQFHWLCIPNSPAACLSETFWSGLLRTPYSTTSYCQEHFGAFLHQQFKVIGFHFGGDVSSAGKQYENSWTTIWGNSNRWYDVLCGGGGSGGWDVQRITEVRRGDKYKKWIKYIRNRCLITFGKESIPSNFNGFYITLLRELCIFQTFVVIN